MSAYVKTMKTADTTGYVLPLPAGGCSRLALGSESGDHWIEPMIGQTSTPADPTNALIASVAGVAGAKSTIHLVPGQDRVLDLASGYSADNASARWTHVRVWAVTGGFVEILGS